MSRDKGAIGTLIKEHKFTATKFDAGMESRGEIVGNHQVVFLTTAKGY